MKKETKTKLITILILFVTVSLGILTRFYKLGEVPHGLYLDEAGQGYSAFSILKTGKDEFGMSFPVVFRSFTDFKTPVYIYLISALIPVFGLTAFTVRFPSFIFSILSIPVLYLLIKEISPNKLGRTLGLIGSVLISFSPWHVLFGRTNFECNVALFFFLSGVYFFYKGLKNPKLLLASAAMLGIAIPAYHSQRLITPFMIGLLFLRHRKKLTSTSHRLYLISGAILGFIILLPTLSVATTPGFLARASGLNIFNFVKFPPPGILPDISGLLGLIINNPFYLSLKEFLALYFSYLSPRNMFILGDYGPRSSFPELSTYFVWQFPFYIYGLWTFFKNMRNLGELKFFVLSLLLIAPIPAAVTRDPYSTIRALPLVVPQTIIIGLGLIAFYQLLRKRIYKVLGLLAFVVIIVYSLARLYSSVIILNEYSRASFWNYGWKEVVTSLNTLDPDLPVVVDIARSEPYSQILFYLKFDPETYQRENFEVSLDKYYTDMSRLNVRKIGRITTKHLNWKEELKKEQYLVGDSLAISDQQIEEHGLSLIDEIYYPDGSVAFRIVKTNP